MTRFKKGINITLAILILFVFGGGIQLIMRKIEETKQLKSDMHSYFIQGYYDGYDDGEQNESYDTTNLYQYYKLKHC